MRIWIDTKELLLLLERKKHEIGNSCIGNMAYILSGLTAIYSSYDTDKWIPIWMIDILGILLIVTGGKGMYKVVTKKNYTHKKLYEDIAALDKTTHPFSIVIIKDTYRPYSNQFLLYRDTKWQCNFFLNYRTQSSEAENEQFIKQRLSNELKIPLAGITLVKLGKILQEKYAVKEAHSKVYDHTYYEARIAPAAFPAALKEKTCTIDGKTYCWMTMEAMRQDKEIREKNLEVVNQVDSFLP